MRTPPLLIFTFAVCLLCAPIEASQPNGLVGEMIGNPNVISQNCSNGFPLFNLPSFQWYEFIGENQIDPTHTVAVDLSMIPFLSGETILELGIIGGEAFLTVTFENGMVAGIPYNRTAWNDVLIRLRPATQDYTITVNGRTAGPFPYSNPCESTGGCFSFQQFQLYAPGSGNGAVAWLDSFTIFDEATVGYGNLFELDFDRCFRPDVTWGGLLISEPPTRPRRMRP
jgi:hypothetical protein